MKIRIGLFIVAALFGGLVSADTPRSWRVGIGRASAIRTAATASGGTVTVTRGPVVINPDGSRQITLFYSNANGSSVHVRTLFIDAPCTKVVDSLVPQTIVSATCPTAENSAASAYTTQLDTTIGNAAAGGKLNL